jgi:hypothetical protein
MTTFVYIARHPTLPRFKIGVSGNPLQRIATLKATLVGMLPGDRCDEKILHAKFSAYALGAEWFQDCPKIRRYIYRNAKRFRGTELPDLIALFARVSPLTHARLREEAETNHRPIGAQVRVILEERYGGAT